MLEELCRDLRNFFYCGKAIFDSTIHITKDMHVQAVLPGQYFRITGSALNDGVYQLDEDGDTILDDAGHPAQLHEETFTGTIWLMAVPKAFLQLVQEIQDWQSKYGDAAAGPYTSESIGTYSYTKASRAGGTGGGYTWKDAFSGRLNAWRKI